MAAHPTTIQLNQSDIQWGTDTKKNFQIFFQKVSYNFTLSVRAKTSAENEMYSSNELFFILSGKLN